MPKAYALRSLFIALVTAGTGAISAPAVGQGNHIPVLPPPVRGEASGFWINPEQPAHGVHLEILEGGKALLSWLTYSSDGQPLWLIGEGNVEGLDIKASLLAFSNGRPPGQWQHSDATNQIWGHVSLTLLGCNDAVMQWFPDLPGFSAGSLDLTRFTRLQGSLCQSDAQHQELRSYSLHKGNPGFEAVFADLPADFDPDIYELGSSHDVLPAPLHNFRGMRLSGHNRSDDLVMMLTTPVKGLEANTYYRVAVDAEIASNVPSGCMGIGGAPGESVFIKLGASTDKPTPSPDSSGWLRMNVDHGNQATGGQDLRLVGTLGNSHSCDNSVDAPWELLHFSTADVGQHLIVKTDNTGQLWLNIATDSGFEGKTEVYLTRARIGLSVW